MTDLTIEEINTVIAATEFGNIAQGCQLALAKQLLVTMKREEKMQEALIYARGLLRETYACDYEIIEEALQCE